MKSYWVISHVSMERVSNASETVSATIIRYRQQSLLTTLYFLILIIIS